MAENTTSELDLPRELANLRFDNRFTSNLPADPVTENHVRQVSGAAYSRVHPTPVAAPRTLAFSREVASLLDLGPEACRGDAFARIFGGNHLLPGMDPFAMCYGGHQFGTWAGQLGDGRAINLGEVVNRRGERWMLQLKGAGPTPYSRGADGLAVLRSSVREFLCSEAMHHLGVPTTRALSLVATGEQVMRDMFYDGHPRFEPGAVVCRVSPSFTRFGNFQIFAARQDKELLNQLIDHTIVTDFPHLGAPSPRTRDEWFMEVCTRTAELMVHWTRVGFVHGVMNTDNMSILGLTIDYGPYGWLEDYDPGWTPNTTDAHGRRYCFGQQPQIAMWNLLQLAQALAVVFDGTEGLQAGLDAYAERVSRGWQRMMADKLGLREFAGEADEQLVSDLLELLQVAEADMTIFYRGLADVGSEQEEGASGGEPEPSTEATLPAPFDAACYRPEVIDASVHQSMREWLERYRRRVAQEGIADAERGESMRRVNPKYVLRNYLAQLAIDKAEAGDPSMIDELLEVLRRPYDEQLEYERYAERRPEWARNRAGCSMLSCSS